MRIDLPQCGLDSCKYSFDGNCTNKQRYQGCEFAYFKRLEAADRLIELPCKVGDAVWTTRWWDNKTITKKIGGETWYRDIFQHKISKEEFSLSLLDRIGKDVFLTKEEAEAKLAELKGE